MTTNKSKPASVLTTLELLAYATGNTVPTSWVYGKEKNHGRGIVQCQTHTIVVCQDGGGCSLPPPFVWMVAFDSYGMATQSSLTVPSHVTAIPANARVPYSIQCRRGESIWTLSALSGQLSSISVVALDITDQT